MKRNIGRKEVSLEIKEQGRFEIWSLRDHLKSFGFLELLHLVKVTETHVQSGLQSSSQGFLNNGLPFPILSQNLLFETIKSLFVFSHPHFYCHWYYFNNI